MKERESVIEVSIESQRAIPSKKKKKRKKNVAKHERVSADDVISIPLILGEIAKVLLEFWHSTNFRRILKILSITNYISDNFNRVN